MTNALEVEFGWVRSFLWPIRRHEVTKVVPMILMLFLICFSYSILRNMKDSVLIDAAGASIIVYVKFWAILPMAVFFTCLFAKLSNRFSQERIFYILTSVFIAFFALFGFVLFPMREQLHLHGFADLLESHLPTQCIGIIALVRYWSFSLFYCMAELWSSIVLTVLFWGFANEITKVEESRRYYGLMGVGSNVAAIIAGQMANYFSSSGAGQNGWEQTVMTLLSIVFCAGLATMVIFWWMNQKVLNQPEFEELHQVAGEPRVLKKKKKRLSMRESLAQLSKSKYLLCLAVVVLSYNLAINLVEVVWKGQLHALYPSPGAFNSYLNNLTSAVGLVSTVTAFIMARMVTRFGWTFMAMLTPMTMLITSIGFFTFFFFQETLSPIAMMVAGTTPLTLVVFFGAAQNCLSKAAKYSVFDTSKEMAYIPLDHEMKLKGKAAIDGVGARLGKSGGSFIQMGLLMMLSNSLTAIAPFVAVILLVMIGGWMAAVRVLGKEYHSLISTSEDEPTTDVKETAPAQDWDVSPDAAPAAS